MLGRAFAVNICPSICLSVRCVHCDKMKKYRRYFSYTVSKWVSAMLFHLFFGNIWYQYFCHQVTSWFYINNNTTDHRILMPDYWYHTDCYKVSYLRLSKEQSILSSAKHVSIMSKRDTQWFCQIHQMIGPTDKEGNFLYECFKCARGQNKPLPAAAATTTNSQGYSVKTSSDCQIIAFP